MSAIDIDSLRDWIGRTETREEDLTPALVDRFNATFDRTGVTERGAEAPLLIHLCLTQPTVPAGKVGPDGHPRRGGFLPPVPLPRRMWAGGAFTLHRALRIGDLVRRVSTIRDVVLKEGRTGPLCFVTVEHLISDSAGVAVRERQDIVYRAAEASAKAAPPVAAPAPPGSHSRLVPTDPVLLFRYSALTFNGHRIHYDQPYVTGTEGYPGLIVHGPMQATLLAQYAADLRGRAPVQFDFRSLSTLYDTQDFALHAQDDGAALRLWTARQGGPVAMEARATW